MTTMQDERETFRRYILSALDDWAEERFLVAKAGWKDQDLPELFKGLDAQFDRLVERFGNPPGTVDRNQETAK